MEKCSGIELSDAISWFKRKRANVRIIFTIKPLVCYNYIVKRGKENDIIFFYKQLDECFATPLHII